MHCKLQRTAEQLSKTPVTEFNPSLDTTETVTMNKVITVCSQIILLYIKTKGRFTNKIIASTPFQSQY